MNETQASPRIAHLSWGRMETGDGRSFKDAKLYPGGARAWDWRETGTHHVPGIQPADVEELLEKGATTVVLSKGIWERLPNLPARRPGRGLCLGDGAASETAGRLGKRG